MRSKFQVLINLLFVLMFIVSGCGSMKNDISQDDDRTIAVNGQKNAPEERQILNQDTVTDNVAGKSSSSEIVIEDGFVTVKPVESEKAFRNPGKGWVAYVFDPENNPMNSSGWPNPPEFCSLVYSNYFTWAMLEPEEGKYRWDIIDRFVEYWSSPPFNKKVGIGIHLTDPSSIKGIYHVPEWLVNTPGMEGRYYDASEAFGVKGEKKFEPNYYNKVFLEKFENFIIAMSERYYAAASWQKGIEYFDISAYGMWGEWHSINFKWPNAETQKKTLKKLVDMYTDAFPQTKENVPGLTMNVVSYSSMNGLDNHAIPYAIEDKGAMMFRRCIGWPEALASDEAEYIQQHYKHTRMIGEWGSTDGTLYKFPGGMNTEQAVNHGLSLHVSYLGWWLPGSPLETVKESTTGETLAEYFQKRCGYRLVLRQANYREKIAPGEEFAVNQFWSQIGAAKMYEKYSLRAYLVSEKGDYALKPDNNFDSTQWLNDGSNHYTSSSFKVPEDIPEGEYELRIAIVDPETGSPAVNIAIEGKDVDNINTYGRYKLGPIEIVSER